MGKGVSPSLESSPGSCSAAFCNTGDICKCRVLRRLRPVEEEEEGCWCCPAKEGFLGLAAFSVTDFTWDDLGAAPHR